MKLSRFLVTVAMSFGLVILPQLAHAAILYATPESQSVEVNRTAVVDVRLNSEKVVVNAVQARVTFNPDAVDILEVSKAGSFLKLWTEEPHVDAATGVITFSGGIPNGSYVINGRLITIVLRPKLVGASTIGIDAGTSGVYLNDGLGTKVGLTTKSARLDAQVLASTLVITSPSHPNEDTWYQSLTAQFSWNATEGAQYAYILNDDPNAIPDTRFGLRTGEATFSDVREGTHYFAITERLPNDTWGPVLRRRVRVDRSAPEDFTVQATHDVVPGKLAVVFATTDTVSEVVRYRVQEGAEVVENATSPYVLRDQQFRSDIRVSAFDAAGNERVVTLSAQPQGTPERGYPAWLWAAGGALVVLCVGALLLARHRRPSA